MRFSTFGILSCFTFLFPKAFAQTAWPPFDPSPAFTVGYIQAATWANTSDVLSGGTLTVNNREYIIPKNLLVNTPVLTAVAWGELFNSDGEIQLPLWPEIAWEATITANYIGGEYIAGLVYIFQETGNTNQGFISHIDYAKGELRIGGTPDDTKSGVRVIISDPEGRFGLVHGDWPLWTSDTESPSIIASTGFPVCIPRADPAEEDDPLCPSKNRPLDTNGKPITQFTFSAPPVPEGQPDPNLFAPLMVGDSVIYSGTLVPDPDGGDERVVAAYAIQANLGFYTTPGTVPAYLWINDALQAGVNGNPRGEIQETRVQGFTTDQTATIQVYTLDVDPCTGEQSERIWGSVVPRDIDIKGEYRFRSESTALPPYTREVRVRMVTGTTVTPNGIIAGEFTSPYAPEAIIFPELLNFGENDLPYEFDKLPFLAQGSGPWLGGVPGVPQAETGPIVGQLSPWPGVAKPTAIRCPEVNPNLPVANAGPDLTVPSGGEVTLSGSLKNSANLTGVTFKWNQTSGTTVTLDPTDAINTTFTAPTVAVVTTLTFAFEASNDEGTTADDVIVNVSPAVVDAITVESVDSGSGGGGTRVLTVVATTNSPVSQLFISADTIQRIAMQSVGIQRFQSVISVRTVPSVVTISSSLGASVTVSTNAFARVAGPVNGTDTGADSGAQNATETATGSESGETASSNSTSAATA
ncbi:hypothetical protein V5O48_008625 [Marasmius crinis-equi]|uniref:Ig-like domain-containing protein n=1 Tax=Marasmius crinis-equi TaxID=585013 RepID=A0ABR3FDD8_9AGAR